VAWRTTLARLNRFGHVLPHGVVPEVTRCQTSEAKNEPSSVGPRCARAGRAAAKRMVINDKVRLMAELGGALLNARGRHCSLMAGMESKISTKFLVGEWCRARVGSWFSPRLACAAA